jgi:transcriptional regulator with XRE-family HTH domain
LNSLGDHLRARRIDLGLFQSQVAAQIGVHELTICNWEGNESQPAIRWIPAIIKFLGYDPANSPSSFPERLIAARKVRGLTQRELAAELGLNPSTIRGWECGAHEPSRKMMKLIDSQLP